MIRIPVRAKAVGLNMTPLIDMVFLLLVYFLLTAHFIEEEGIGVRLPSAASRVQRQDREVAVALSREGVVFLGGAAVGVDELEERLRAAAQDGETTVVVRGDRDVALQAVVSVMEAAKKAGAARIVVATLHDGGGP
jgi:biopolymer transport protein ExbD